MCSVVIMFLLVLQLVASAVSNAVYSWEEGVGGLVEYLSIPVPSGRQACQNFEGSFSVVLKPIIAINKHSFESSRRDVDNYTHLFTGLRYEIFD